MSKFVLGVGQNSTNVIELSYDTVQKNTQLFQLQLITGVDTFRYKRRLDASAVVAFPILPCVA